MEFAFSGILVRYAAHGQQNLPNPGPNPSPALNAGVAPVLDQLHVNLWEVGSDSILDLGIMISDWSNVCAVQIDLPWSIERQQIMDLGSRLNSEKTIAAIFNEVVHYDGCADLNFAKISFRPGDVVDLTGTPRAIPVISAC